MPELPFVEGFLLGAGLLVALGPKDTFVIKNSLHGHNAITLVIICAFADVLLIVLGVGGFGAAVATSRLILVSAMVLSIGYLAYFSAKAFASAYEASLQPVLAGAATLVQSTRAQVVRGALFHSLLTPYAWLDTVLVIGAISATKSGSDRWFFAGGAMTASVCWFVFLTVGSRLAAPLFQSRRAWQVLDVIVAISMLVLAAKLVADYPWLPV